ncbi:MAG: heat-inducible transcriptional repressor HrcA [Alphaproteobacteria bacterium]|jgi:heat-inducible transcriptional repressor|nr:heat-inducible transcriptional repressor HrcA [Alphaproteobacteria bacterium]
MQTHRPVETIITELDERSREIFREIVEAYMDTGTPVGSRTLSRRSHLTLSPASIRNVMADLEAAGLLYAPHTSAGRLPTERGLRMFVDGLLEIGDLTEEERASIEVRCAQNEHSLKEMLESASETLSGLSHCAGVVLAPTIEAPLKHIEFVNLDAGRVIVVIVFESGQVENRVLEIPPGMPPSVLIEASNFLNERLRGRTFQEARNFIESELEARRAELDELTSRVVEAGLATWGGEGDGSTLIVRGRANLLDDVQAMSDLERVRQLFDDLESTREFASLLQLAQDAEGVRIFIGSENRLFSLSGSSLIVAPFSNAHQRIVGAIGVIGPTHLNYARIVPMVDYTAQVIGRLIG